MGQIDAGTIAAGTWVSIDQPISNFIVTGIGGLATIDRLQQIGLFPTNPGMVLYLDNLYFYK
jgi:hypothetical protein